MDERVPALPGWFVFGCGERGHGLQSVRLWVHVVCGGCHGLLQGAGGYGEWLPLQGGPSVPLVIFRVFMSETFKIFSVCLALLLLLFCLLGLGDNGRH